MPLWVARPLFPRSDRIGTGAVKRPASVLSALRCRASPLQLERLLEVTSATWCVVAGRSERCLWLSSYHNVSDGTP